jgi:hypothetical protein
LSLFWQNNRKCASSSATRLCPGTRVVARRPCLGWRTKSWWSAARFRSFWVTFCRDDSLDRSLRPPRPRPWALHMS